MIKMRTSEFIYMKGNSSLREPDSGLKGNYYELPTPDFTDEIESLSDTCFHLNSDEFKNMCSYIKRLSKEQRKKYREEMKGEEEW